MSRTEQKTKTKLEKSTEEDGIIPEGVQERRTAAEEAMKLADSILDEIDAVLSTDEVVEIKKSYTLADMMREGSKDSKQAFSKYETIDGGERCALSAALYAIKKKGLA